MLSTKRRSALRQHRKAEWFARVPCRSQATHKHRQRRFHRQRQCPSAHPTVVPRLEHDAERPRCRKQCPAQYAIRSQAQSRWQLVLLSAKRRSALRQHRKAERFARVPYRSQATHKHWQRRFHRQRKRPSAHPTVVPRLDHDAERPRCRKQCPAQHAIRSQAQSRWQLVLLSTKRRTALCQHRKVERFTRVPDSVQATHKHR